MVLNTLLTFYRYLLPVHIEIELVWTRNLYKLILFQNQQAKINEMYVYIRIVNSKCQLTMKNIVDAVSCEIFSLDLILYTRINKHICK